MVRRYAVFEAEPWPDAAEALLNGSWAVALRHAGQPSAVRQNSASDAPSALPVGPSAPDELSRAAGQGAPLAVELRAGPSEPPQRPVVHAFRAGRRRLRSG